MEIFNITRAVGTVDAYGGLELYKTYPMNIEGYGETSIKAGKSFNNYIIDGVMVHGITTHTESCRHVVNDGPYIHNIKMPFLMNSLLTTVKNTKISSNIDGEIDSVITLENLLDVVNEEQLKDVDCLVVRALNKKIDSFSNTNPIYFSNEAMKWIGNKVNHFVTDLPSVERENSAGLMMAHKAFFYNNHWRYENTITELVYIPMKIQDGSYKINITPSAYPKMDAVPSTIKLIKNFKL